MVPGIQHDLSHTITAVHHLVRRVVALAFTLSACRYTILLRIHSPLSPWTSFDEFRTIRRMCHRYHVQTTRIDIAAALGMKLHGVVEWSQNDLYPLNNVPVVVVNGDGGLLLQTMQWGLLPSWWKPSEKHKKPSSFQRMTFNARSETIDSKPSYRDAFKQRRCLIPATEFYEGPKGNAAYFQLAGSNVMFLAGLWESWRSQDETIESCTIVTTQANDLVAKYHPRNRMPVILPDENSRRLWVSSDVIERPLLEELFQPLRDDLMSHRCVDVAIRKGPALWD